MTLARFGVTPLFYNSESRTKEPVHETDQGPILMYTCGPTVYDYAHIGNFRTYIFEDLLRRALEFFGAEVRQVMNLTDVDDKTIKGALAEKKSLEAFTQTYKDAFFEDIKTLNIQPAAEYPAATDYLPQMLEMIANLLEKKIAYEGQDGSIYFSIKKFPRYGCLSHLKQEDLLAGASNRVNADEYDKDHVSDFVLWKAYDPQRDGDIFWESPYGKGRPGWHLECSAMAMDLLGETINIHCGGVDNLFPHHENEIAQSEACTGNLFVRHWMHSEHLIVDGKKMSKSLGNFFTLRQVLDQGFSGRELRYMLLHTHYRSRLNFTFDGLTAVRSSLERIDDFIYRLQTFPKKEGGDCRPIWDEALATFAVAIGDDLNISSALSALFDLIREANALLDQGKIGKKDAEKILAVLKEMDQVLGVIYFPKEEEKLPEDLVDAMHKRQEARKEKNWSLADELRDLIEGRGYTVEDTPSGPRLKRK